MGGKVQFGGQIMSLLDIHGLSESNVRSDRRAEEVEDPERGDDADVKFPVLSSRR